MHEIARRAGRMRAKMGAALAVLAVLLPVVGCTGQNKENTAMSTDADATTEAPPLRRLNPHPVQAYAVRVVLDKAPGPFASVAAVAQYTVRNPGQCAGSDSFVGAVPVMTSNEPIVLSKLSDTEYAGTVYVDQILDEDYFGRGACVWELTEARVVFKATGDKVETRFVAGLPRDSIVGQGQETRYFWNGHYPKAGMDGFGAFGQDSLERVPEDRRNEFFNVTMSSREAAS